MVSAAQVEIYATFNGDIDMYQRRGSPQKAIVGDAWSTIDDLRRRLFLVAVEHASVQFVSSTEADLLAWTENEDARRRIRALVERDVIAQSNA
ncbi:MAG TPA: hypothetical protein VK820_10205 [Steroidobacteraceae bacterium]|jgi:hypothetical protein|nr:hypothetical protein [Steroidobacteraceae bacterium]